MDYGADVNIEDSNKTTPLHSACFHGHSRIAKLLIDSKANINAQDQRGNTPLHSAVSGGHAELVNLLLDNKCDTTIANKEGQYFTHLVNEFLVTAVEASKVAQVASLIKGRADPNSRDAYGYTVLCQASFKGDLLIVEALLEGGADPNLPDETQKKTPLHYAAAWGHLFVVRALLEKGAFVNKKDKLGGTALHEAAREGYEDVIEILVGRGCNVNEVDEEGNTALHVAGRWGHNASVELLLERYAKEDIRNKNHQLYSDLALIRAVRTADLDHVVHGMAWGGDPNSRDERGWTLLHHAAYKGVEDICALLLENGASVNAIDRHDRTPLLLAAYRGNHQIMQMLLDAGADTDSQDWMGRTPLHWAAKEGSVDAVQILLDHKANTTITNKEGDLYSSLLLKHLYFAVRRNDAEKAAKLVMAGADQFAEIEGTGINSREEAKRRGFFSVLQRMAALAEKKPQKDDDITVAIEDVYRLFEDTIIAEEGDFASTEEDQPEFDGDEEDEGLHNSDEEDAYWKMSNAYEVLSVQEAFGEEDTAWLKEFEEKPKVISAKELMLAEQEAFWDEWQEKPTVIPASEFFKEETNWWEKDDDDDDNDADDDDEDKEKDKGYWWQDTEANLDKPKGILAKDYFKEENSWWTNGSGENENEDSEKEYTSDAAAPWWKSKDQMSNVISAEEYLQHEEKPWWQQDKVVSAKELFEEEKPWWKEDEDKDKMVPAKEFFKEEVPWWQQDKVVSAEEFFKDDEPLPWWYTEEMPVEKSGLKKSLASVQFYERCLLERQMYEEKHAGDVCNSERSGDEGEGLYLTDECDDRGDSLISNCCSSLCSNSELEGSSLETVPRIIPGWMGYDGECKQKIPKADDFFQEKHWLDALSETSDPTETLDMDISEISENDIKAEPWTSSVDNSSKTTGTEISEGNSVAEETGKEESKDEEEEEEEEGEEEEEYMEEEGEEEEMEEEMEEEEEELEEELEAIEEGDSEGEEEEDLDEEMDEEGCSSEEGGMRSEDDIEDISQEDLDIIEIVSDNKFTKQGNENSVTFIDQTIPTIKLHENGDEIKLSEKPVINSPTSNKSSSENLSVDLTPAVVSSSYDTLEKTNTNIDIEITNSDSLLDPNQYCISVPDIGRNLQKSDSQTSGYDSSFSLSESKVKELPKDSVSESLDECVEDTDISDMTNPVSSENIDSLDFTETDDQDTEQEVLDAVNDVHLVVKEMMEYHEEATNSILNSEEYVANMVDSTKVGKTDENKIFIHMQWDTDDKQSSGCQEESSSDFMSVNTDEHSINSTSSERPKEILKDLSDHSPSHLGNDKTLSLVSEDGSENLMEARSKTYASVVKGNSEKSVVNRMDDCLARVAATLAVVDTKLTKEDEKKPNNKNDNQGLSYAEVLKTRRKEHSPDGKSALPENCGTKILPGSQKIKEEKENMPVLKVQVNFPKNQSETEETETVAFPENKPKANYCTIKQNISKTSETNDNFDKCSMSKFQSFKLENSDSFSEKNYESELSSINPVQSNGGECEKTGTADKNDVTEKLLQERRSPVDLDSNKKETSPDTEPQSKKVSNAQSSTDGLPTGDNITEDRLSRESSVEKFSSHEGSESPKLKFSKSLWRCSTYDALSISDYDIINFSCQTTSQPGLPGSPRSFETNSLNKVEGIHPCNESKNSLNQSSPSSNPKENTNEKIHSLENDDVLSSSDKDQKMKRDDHTGTAEKTNGKKTPVSLNQPGEKPACHIVPEASSGESRVLGAEACTNPRDSSSNETSPIAMHQTKENNTSLSHQVKYKVFDHSEKTIASSSHSFKQPTNSTLYDPDKKETHQIESASKERPEELRLREASHKRSKESNKKDKEKQKELAVVTGKIDPVRKSSSCSVS